MNLQLKRVYEPYSTDDGVRVLVDRLWPRGVQKAVARVDVWLKEIAPSSELRKWYHANRELYAEFKAAYEDELHTSASHRIAVQQLIEIASSSPTTLLYSARETINNHAVIIVDYIRPNIS